MGKLFWVVVIFLLVGAYIIKAGYDINLGESSGRQSFALNFGKWILQIGGNIVDLTSRAIEQDWFPKINNTNQTNQTFYIFEKK
jgi:hypothetical protein